MTTAVHPWFIRDRSENIPELHLQAECRMLSKNEYLSTAATLASYLYFLTRPVIILSYNREFDFTSLLYWKRYFSQTWKLLGRQLRFCSDQGSLVSPELLLTRSSWAGIFSFSWSPDLSWWSWATPTTHPPPPPTTGVPRVLGQFRGFSEAS